MVSKPEFQQEQERFTAYIRNPMDNAPPGGIEERRMAVYRDLFFENIKDFISNGFPVLKTLYSEENWNALIRQFFSLHQCQTPYFSRIAEEFLDYLQHEHVVGENDPPFLLELAHYEWVELAVSIDTDEIDWSQIDRHGDLLSGIPIISPLVWSLSYTWPVHEIRYDYQPKTPPEQPTFLTVWRNGESDVEFMEANAVTARLIQLLQENEGRSGQQLLEQIAEELQHPQPEMVIQGGHQILVKLHKREIIPGTQIAR
ncbi:MAG: HvfC family RiPP maturation protein [bacterium]